MSNENENARQVLGAASGGYANSAFGRRRLVSFGIWLVLVLLFLFAFNAGWLDLAARSPAAFAFPLGILLLWVLVIAGSYLFARSKVSKTRDAYWRALREADPGALIAVADRALKGDVMPDVDAFRAQSRALAYALYGRGELAFEAMGSVDWSAKAPMIQALGLSAEAVTELLCRRAAPRAHDLARRARELASISGSFPGAAESNRYYETCLAAAAVLANEPAPKLSVLEASAADSRFPQRRLIASFALAIAAERAVDGERAARLRAFVREAAPHCAPLLLSEEEYAAPGAWSDARNSPALSPK